MDGSHRKPPAPVSSQLCEDVKTETCMKDGETSSSEGNLSDQQNGEFFRIVVKEEPEDEDYVCGETSSSISLNGELQKKPVKEEEPEDQDSLYCEECGSSFINKCEVHGPPRFIPDTPVPTGVSDRARRTLPPGLEVRESGIPNAGLGVFNVGETVPIGVHFGPYEGDLVDRDEAMKSGYSWVIKKNRRCEEYVDAERELNTNWMRFVNCARNDEENNLVAFQYRGEILYRCCRTVQPGQELLLWYDEEYAKDLGITFECLWKKKCSANGSDDAPFQTFSCSLCPLTYTSQDYLHKHMKRCHSDEYHPLLAGSSDSEQKSIRTLCVPPKRTNKGIHNCSYCGRSFARLFNLKTHQRFHTGEKPYQCLQCGKSFAHQITLQRHQRIHTGEKPYLCSQCGKSFSIQSHLQRHWRIHAGEKPYQCSQCRKRFTQKKSLQIHQRIHTGERPYQCSQCGRSFTRPDHLKMHQRIHTGEKPYYCSQCGKSFTRQSNLRNHQQVHTGTMPYHCSQCGRSFTRRDHLEMHQRMHTGEKPYYCSQCGKSFTRQSNLRNHQQVHTGTMPYHCSQCGRSFTDRYRLRAHERIHSGEKPHQCS